MLPNILNSNIFKGASILFVSTLLSQFIVVVTSPIITRIYTPKEFGYFVIFNSIVGYFAVISTLRFEYAILVPRDEGEAKRVLQVSLCSSLLVGAISFVLLYSLQFISTGIDSYLLLSSIVIIFFGVHQSMLNWFNRQEKYLFMAIGGISLTVVGVTAQLLLSSSSVGLIYGRIIGVTTAAIILIFIFNKNYKLPKLKKTGLIEAIKKHKKFPIYNAPQAFINKSSVELPIILLAVYFDDITIAFYGLATRILMMPLSFIANAISKPLIPAILKYKTFKEVKATLLKIELFGFLIFVPIGLLIFFYSEPLFSWAFGEEWIRAGTYARILLPFFLFRFMGSPIAILGSLIGYQDRMLILSIARVIGVVICLVVGGLYLNIENTLLLFSVFGAVYWIVSILHTFYLFRLKLNA